MQASPLLSSILLVASALGWPTLPWMEGSLERRLGRGAAGGAAVAHATARPQTGRDTGVLGGLIDLADLGAIR